MLGFIIGTVCLFGLIKVGACAHGGRRYGRRHHGYGERGALRWLFERLDTTHGQEKVILEAVEELRDPWRELRESGVDTLGVFADATRKEAFDHGRVAELWVRQDKSLEVFRVALTAQLARVHEVLDERQRRSFASIIARFGRFA